jgi:hypothetical protein
VTPLFYAVGRCRHGRSIFDWLCQLVHFAIPRVADDFILVIAAVEFALIWQNADYLESRVIPGDDGCPLFALN